MTSTGKDCWKRNPHILLMEMTSGATILEKKKQNKLSVPHAVKRIYGIWHNPAIPGLCIHLREMKARPPKNWYTNVHRTLYTTAKT